MTQHSDSSGQRLDPFEPSRVDFGLSRDPWGRLRLIDHDGRSHEQVNVVPLFPITDPDRWITICDADGRELVCFEDPKQLFPDARAVLQDELSRREFLPVISRIVHVSGLRSLANGMWTPTAAARSSCSRAKKMSAAWTETKWPSPTRTASAIW